MDSYLFLWIKGHNHYLLAYTIFTGVPIGTKLDSSITLALLSLIHPFDIALPIEEGKKDTVVKLTLKVILIIFKKLF